MPVSFSSLRRQFSVWHSAEARRVRFHLDGVSTGRLRGWVFLRDDAERRLFVFAEDRTGVRTEHVADLYRADVHRAGIGSDGYCGFSIALRSMAPDTPIVCKQPYRELARGPWMRNPAPPPRHASYGDLLFHVDGGLSGWLSSAATPDARREIQMRVDGRLASTQTACLFRAVRPDSICDDYHGFAFTPPTKGRIVELVDGATGLRLYRGRIRA